MAIVVEEASPEILEAQADLKQETPEDLLNDLMDVVVYQISRRLNELGWTQQRLADEMGVSAPQVSRLLRATENTSLLTIARAAHALDLTVGALKLIPNEEADQQIDEIKSFVMNQESDVGWWPATKQASSYVEETLELPLFPKLRQHSRYRMIFEQHSPTYQDPLQDLLNWHGELDKKSDSLPSLRNLSAVGQEGSGEAAPDDHSFEMSA